MLKIRVYIGDFIQGVPTDLPVLFPNFGNTTRRSELFFDTAVRYIKEPIFDIVVDPSCADFLLIPYNHFNLRNYPGYIDNFIELSKQYNKKIIVFEYSDYHEQILIPNSIIFRTSLYRAEKKENEYVVPPFVEDLSEIHPFFIRKKSTRPIVGFCGWAKVRSVQQWLKLHTRNLQNNLNQFFKLERALGAHKKGIYFRGKAISALENSSLVKTNFIIRSSFSGNIKTISLDSQKARIEYIENIESSDFILSPKGDGNYSLRFYEALSLGRIPLLIDTDSVLPAEDELNYDSFILRVDYRDINRLDKIVADFYSKLTEEEFMSMQNNARIAFVEHLRCDLFLKHIVSILVKKIDNPLVY